MVEWKICPDYHQFECSYKADIRRVDGKPFVPFLMPCRNKPSRKYRSLINSRWGFVYNQVFKAWGQKNPDRSRYDCIDHIDNNSLNDSCDNLRWSNHKLNALNTDDNQSKGWEHYPRRKTQYKARVKWMGKLTSLGYYKTSEEAHSVYLECKAFIQRVYCEQICEDILLVYEFKKRRNKRLGIINKRSETQVNTQINKMRKLGLIK